MAAHRPGRGRTDRAPENVLPLDTARECFVLLVAGPQPLSLDGRAFRGLPHRTIPLDELRDRLLRRNCPRRTRDAVWAHLVHRSRREGATWTLACAGMALPALAGVARRLAEGFPGDPFDVHAEVLTGFLGALETVDVARPRVLPRLRWAAYRQGFAALMEALDAPTPAAPGFRSAAPRPPWGHPDLVLARAVRESVLTRTEADVIGATRLDKVAVEDWAAQRHTTPNAAYKLRRRAEARLIAFLHGEAQDNDPNDPVALSAMGGLPSVSALPARRNAVSALAGSSPSVVDIGGSRVPDRAEESSIGVAKKGADSGLLRCGSTTPASTSLPASEVP
ncbi:hypothetical protein [Streptomyces fulvoviolaceus]|uniref:hypothetical protein n=1 Tax=Streptomyces fulvoviolaceus TaxID=285535 RepID=UPI0021C24D8A|nr:hypothetical protein [Streptomyces fulvoviolaceus]MCT9084461.1 hypothetical protein [Streptomyces fulvoviolaceus]